MVRILFFKGVLIKLLKNTTKTDFVHVELVIIANFVCVIPNDCFVNNGLWFGMNKWPENENIQ